MKNRANSRHRLDLLPPPFRKNRRSDYASGNTIVRSAKGIHLAASAIMFLSGVLLCSVQSFGDTAVRLVVALCCIVIGGADIFGYYSNDLFRLAFQFAFTFGAYSAIFGLLLLIMPDRLTILLPYAVACYVILDGLQKVQISLEGRKFGIGKWFLILGTSIAVVLLGFLSVFFLQGGAAGFLWMGIAVAANGAENFWTTMYTVRIRTGRETDPKVNLQEIAHADGGASIS